MIDDDAQPRTFSPDHDPADATQWLADTRECLIFSTRLPVRRESAVPVPLAGAMRAFPLAGLIVGLIGGAVLVLAHGLGLAPPIAAMVAVGAGVLVTGALHEDGLADVADGFGGGEGREAKLDIMRDSRIGTYGVLALLFALVLKAFAIASVVVGTSVWGGLFVMVAAAGLSRSASAGLLHVLPPARGDGLSFEAGRPGRSTVLQAAGLGVAMSVIFLWPYSLALGLLLLPLAAAAGFALTAWLAERQIGGQTGDVAGAAQVVSEVAILLTAAAVLGR